MGRGGVCRKDEGLKWQLLLGILCGPASLVRGYAWLVGKPVWLNANVRGRAVYRPGHTVRG